MDYHALAAILRSNGANEADLIGYAEVDADRHPLVRMTRRLAGRDAALAMIGFVRGKQYDAVFTNGENIAIPLAFLWKSLKSRPAHVTIGHRLSAGKKRFFFTHLRIQEAIDRILVYSDLQHEFARKQLGISEKQIQQIHFHADDQFFRPLPNITPQPDTVCAAGLEWRDYPTLITAAPNASKDNIPYRCQFAMVEAPGRNTGYYLAAKRVRSAL